MPDNNPPLMYIYYYTLFFFFVTTCMPEKNGQLYRDVGCASQINYKVRQYKCRVHWTGGAVTLSKQALLLSFGSL